MPGPAVAIAGASLGSAAMGASASKKAGEQAARSADAATALQREIYTDTTERFKPYVEAGGNALQAVLYEMGLGARPTFGGSTPGVEEFTETLPAGQPGQGVALPPSGMGFGGRDGAEKRAAAEAAAAAAQPSSVTRFRVNGQNFDTRSAAEEYAAANKTGGIEYGGYTETPMARYLLEKGVDSIDASAASRGNLFSGATLQALEDNRREVITADTDKYFARLAGITDMGLGAAGNQASAGANFANSASQTMMQAGQARAQGTLGAASAWQTGISDIAGTAGYFGWGGNSNPMAAYTSPTMASSPRPMANPRF